MRHKVTENDHKAAYKWGAKELQRHGKIPQVEIFQIVISWSAEKNVTVLYDKTQNSSSISTLAKWNERKTAEG